MTPNSDLINIDKNHEMCKWSCECSGRFIDWTSKIHAIFYAIKLAPNKIHNSHRPVHWVKRRYLRTVGYVEIFGLFMDRSNHSRSAYILGQSETVQSQDCRSYVIHYSNEYISKLIYVDGAHLSSNGRNSGQSCGVWRYKGPSHFRPNSCNDGNLSNSHIVVHCAECKNEWLCIGNQTVTHENQTWLRSGKWKTLR